MLPAWCLLLALSWAVKSILDTNSNLAAEQALLAYLGLTEVYLQNRITDSTLVEIANLQDVLRQLQEDELLRDVDPEMLVRKKLEVQLAQQEILFNYEKLNRNLEALLGLQPSVHPVWTDCQIMDWALPTDLSAELQLAREHRTDLQGIRQLAGLGQEEALDVLRRSVATASPLAGVSLDRPVFSGKFADRSAEMRTLQQQLATLYQVRVELAESLVSEHFHAIQKNNREIQLNRERLASLRRSEARLETLRQVGPIQIEQVLTVKSDILKARSEIIHSAIALQMSWIRLKGAQGLLGRLPQGEEMASTRPVVHQGTRSVTGGRSAGFRFRPEKDHSVRATPVGYPAEIPLLEGRLKRLPLR